MGVNIKDLIDPKEITTKELEGKVLAIDAFNMLYQFLSTIRARDGTLFTNAKGNITSHLIGLFHRTTALLEQKAKPVFIFDGAPPKQKAEERARRAEIKASAEEQLQAATEAEDTEAMRKFASRTSRLTKDMIDEAITLLHLLGIPTIHAPSEGEAQAALLVKNKDAFAAVSQDYDSLLFGCPLLVRNLSISGRRRKIHGLGTVAIQPEILSLTEVLNQLGIDQQGLIALGMLVGTDFNYGGIKGIGPKKALALVKKHGKDLDTLFNEVNWNDNCSYPWKEVFSLFTDMPTTSEYEVAWKQVNADGLRTFLIDENAFSVDRVEKALEKLSSANHQQKGLGEFF